MHLAGDVWQGGPVRLGLALETSTVRIWLEAPGAAVRRLRLSWDVPVQGEWRLLGDAWERGYGDLEWRGLVPDRVLPWYFLAANGRQAGWAYAPIRRHSPGGRWTAAVFT